MKGKNSRPVGAADPAQRGGECSSAGLPERDTNLEFFAARRKDEVGAALLSEGPPPIWTFSVLERWRLFSRRLSNEAGRRRISPPRKG